MERRFGSSFARLRLRGLALPAVAAFALALAVAPSAQAASCSLPLPGLEDSLHFNWDIKSESLNAPWSDPQAGGWIDKGGYIGQDNDAYDGWGVLRIGASAVGPTVYPPPSGPCGTEEGDREITFPPFDVGELRVSRKIYVPASGLAFARFLDVVENPADGGSAVTTIVSYEGDLGSDTGTKVIATSDGNSTVAPNDVQTISISGSPTGGTFTLTYNGETTAPIAYNATAATVDSALEALSNIGSRGVTVGGGALPGNAVTVAFDGASTSGRDHPVMTTDSSGLAGGTSPTASVVHTTVGASPDRWATSVQDPLDPPPARQDPPLAHVWDGPGAPPHPTNAVYGDSTGGTDAWHDGEARVRIIYNVTVPEGQTYTFMHFEAQRSTRSEALAAAQTLGNLTDISAGDAFAGLTEAEISSLQNWNPNDLDGDGATSPGDNCRFVSNPGQENLDGDSLGDACDGDIDGDGLSNSTEALIGTDSRKADTDGDGFGDAVDGCPLTAGPANGCPASPPSPSPPPGPAADTTPPKIRIAVARSMKRRSFLKGLTVAVTSNEAASLKFELLGSRGRSRRSRKFSTVLARQSLPTAGAGTRALRLRPSRRLLARRSRFPVQLRVTAVDRSTNRTVETRTIRIR